MTGQEYIDRADESLDAAYEAPMSLAEYVDTVLETPQVAAHASKYLLDAIEDAGTRMVIEEGEEKERYRFFDDPYNDGEHAILGNTEVLNAFVDDLRSIAAGRGKDEKIIWLEGPTATGKSELKRCLINGLREYSKTPEGRRYTVEWNVAGAGNDATSMTYGNAAIEDEDDWYESPVQAHPLTVFPEDVRTGLLAEVNERLDDHIPIRVDGQLDPFSREAYDFLEEQYRRQGETDLFSAVTQPSHLRVKNFVVDVGRGIGILHSEDEGTPKERLVGSWMHGMLRELDSRGRKNPQAFSYDGVLSQGNGLLTVVEDAAQHADLLQKLLNVPDESHVKLDKGIGMDVDTQLVIISNPDLEAQLNKHADREGQDPLKALKRRLDKHEFTYLTNLSLEAQLLRRELTNETQVWDPETWDELETWIQEPLSISVRDQVETATEKELAPHTVESAALYAVVSRLDSAEIPTGLDLVDKALLFDRGYLMEGDERVDIDDYDLETTAEDGDHGIPVTYVRDIIADLLHEPQDRHHPDLPVEHVLMPRDVLNAVAEGLSDAPVFSTGEATEYEERVVTVKNYIFGQQEQDVLDAMMRDKRVDEATVEEYIEHVYAWESDDQIENERGERVDPDPLKMKVFEIEHLGRFDEKNYDGNEPDHAVEQFRTDKIITALNRHAWQRRDEEFRVGDVNPKEIPVINTVLGSYDWDDIQRTYEDFEPGQWDNPPSGTETARLKAKTLDNMVEMFDYTAASAELTSRHVMSQVSYRWD
ncbi:MULTISPECIES: PrkA family serine protein kinase [Haloarcula]|uniref:Kinase anchor protein n=2 Tax=Haloarcula marismortui TaxID=2238 RepID=M0JZL2_9EURY|nr:MULTISPECIES: kinase anchor protein [Haloarcula]EMA12494.1 kinase anchor protein [Haloarcula californiae ATCC 33799]EMA13953.1 kinase anchor protein [Haloarcula sinaiiensis ATCC 33800]NHX38160.1 kinase anchor protein [Haloarcula sp. R1-2]QUJ73119.1 kinase anchor protein [Haloarcula sinaiiensis ATCC 33800]